MKQKLNLREKLSMRLGATLEYTAAGIALAGVVVGLLFTFNILGNKKNAVANSHSVNKILLLPEEGIGNDTDKTKPTIVINNTSDSLFIDFSSSDDQPINNAVLRMQDVPGGEPMAQIKVMTCLSPQNINKSSYHFAIPVRDVPERIKINASAFTGKKIHAAKGIQKAWTSEFIYNRKNSSVTNIQGGVKAATIQ